ncbi:THUMP domain-containing class I SAM-dependent RNA methyltransferase [Spirochaeta cellobiosiphila]|uniref:THUMP domain-containing class I SAM-dependent RNA methyltransferase n=1 Tax=Spirochaeta cellobiosiphila TaxID=504483 RepID=UPI000409EEE1|nr:class I SAM-dependent RNA methyltransferase [Spirochaeta cellobiosiphila]
MEIIILHAPGIEKALEKELDKLGLTINDKSRGRIIVDTDLEGLYKAHIYLRTAERILLKMGTWKCHNFDQLFDGIKELNWSLAIDNTWNIKIDKVRSYRSEIKSSPITQKTAHKAILEALNCTEKTNNRKPANIRLYWDKDELLVGLDLTGDGLHKRGYREEAGKAPLRETLAAAMIIYSGWQPGYPIHDPFCGSGTILIEAALMDLNIAPGIKKTFTFEQMNFHEEDLWKKVKREARLQAKRELTSPLSGGDNYDKVLDTARLNAKKAGIGDQILFYKEDATKGEADFDEGYIITNPPYGERLQDKQKAEDLYRSLSQWNESYPSWRKVIITNNEKLEKLYNQQAHIKRYIQYGSLDVTLYQFN